MHSNFADYICSTLLTMKDYFLKLLNYDSYSNLQLTELLFSANEPQNAVGLMAHIISAKQRWLLRCKELPPPSDALWPDWQAAQFKYLIEEGHHAWVEYVGNLTDDDFKRIINYQNMKGENMSDTLSDILAHLINHGTHHRAQIGQHLKLAGLEQLPVTDYIFYVRQQTQQ